MLDDCGVPAETQDELIARVREIGAHRSMRAYDEVAEVLAELRARGLTLAICSNWDWDLEEAIEAAGLAGTVDVDGLVGVGRRPQAAPAHVRRGARRVGVAPDDALFVGDTWSCDVEGPRAAGLAAGLRAPAALRTRRDRARRPPTTQDVHRADRPARRARR